jgi:PTH1 family peptidyl-tRNA hydrolase
LKVIVGLGNPGIKYRQTRHNMGFMVVDNLAAKHSTKFCDYDKLYKFGSFQIHDQQIHIIKPLTFMNNSGNAVREVVTQLKISDYSNLLIISDDINLSFGVIRLRAYGSAGGQKGIQSVISAIGTQAFPRLRIGIGSNFEKAEDYVLSKFTRKERKVLPNILDTVVTAVEFYIERGISLTMSKFNKNLIEN